MNAVKTIAIIVVFLAIAGVFVKIPFVSDYAFWFVVVAFLMVFTSS